MTRSHRIPLRERLSLMVQHALPGTLVPVDSIRELLGEEQARAASAPGLSLEEVARRCAALGSRKKPVQPSTVRKWIREGLRGVRLTAFRWGKSYRITDDALQEFIGTVQDASAQRAPPPVPSGSGSVEDEIAAARRRFAGENARG